MQTIAGGSRKKKRKSKKDRELATETFDRHVTPAGQEVLDVYSRWLTPGPQHPLAGQVCPSPGGILICSLLFWGCRNAPEHFWEIVIPPMAFILTGIMFMCLPHPAKPIVTIFAWNHGFRAAWWLWRGPMPFVLFFLGMSWPLIPCFGKKPHWWSPTGGMTIGYIGFKFGERVAYECHTPTRDCNYSGAVLDKDDALCEIDHDVLFFDLGSDGQVWSERFLLLLLVAILFLATTKDVFGIEGFWSPSTGWTNLPTQQ